MADVLRKEGQSAQSIPQHNNLQVTQYIIDIYRLMQIDPFNTVVQVCVGDIYIVECTHSLSN